MKSVPATILALDIRMKQTPWGVVVIGLANAIGKDTCQACGNYEPWFLWLQIVSMTHRVNTFVVSRRANMIKHAKRPICVAAVT
jgi:hypothetical protein